MNMPAPFEQMLTLSQDTTKTLAEVGSLLIVIAGVWFFFAEFSIPSMKFAKLRRIVASILLAAAGILLIIAFHWGQFG
jgi:hypothetical protein